MNDYTENHMADAQKGWYEAARNGLASNELCCDFAQLALHLKLTQVPIAILRQNAVA